MDEVKSKIKQHTAQSSTGTHALAKQEKTGLTDVELAYSLSAPPQAGIGTVGICISSHTAMIFAD